MVAQLPEVPVPAPKPRSPVVPPEQSWPSEHHDHVAMDFSALNRLEARLEIWMANIDRRFDHIAHLCATPPSPLAQIVGPGRRKKSMTSPGMTVKSFGESEADSTNAKDSVDKKLTDMDNKSVMLQDACDASMDATKSDAAGLFNHAGVASASSQAVLHSNTADDFAKRFSLMHDMKLSEDNYAKENVLQKIVGSQWFDAFIAVVVIANVLMVGVQVDFEVRKGDGAVGVAFEYFEYVCTGIFTVEITLRVIAFGVRKLMSPKMRWLFALDFVLVMISWADIILSVAYTVGTMGDSAFLGKLFKMIRLVRVARILRTMRLLVELRAMAIMIVSSLRSIVWLTCILIVVTYIFALVLTQGAAAYLNDPVNPPVPFVEAKMREAYGSLITAMHSLIKGMTGGRNWGELSDIISEAGWFFAIVMLAYIFLNLFSILNIVTGVFVDGAIEHAKRDRSLMVDRQSKKRENSANNLMALLLEIDVSGDGQISEVEFMESLNRKEVREFMDALSINLDDAAHIFRLLDRDMDGTVGIVEFVHGMEKMQGEAKSSDIQILCMQMEQVQDILKRISQMLPPEKREPSRAVTKRAASRGVDITAPLLRAR